MSPTTPERKTVFSTPWFQVLASEPNAAGQVHYTINAPDFVVVVALDDCNRLLTVRQFRPAVGLRTLELPAGHVDPGETPEQAARKELLEETGYEAERFTLIGNHSPSTARFTNRMWCFFAPNARPATSPKAIARREAGVDLELYERGARALIEEPDFASAHSCAAVGMAVLRGKLSAD